MDMQDVYTLRELAVYLRISKSTLIRRIRRGEVKVIYISPRTPRITKEEVERILQRGGVK